MTDISMNAALPGHSAMTAFLERVLPGTSPAIREAREGLMDFASTPTARTMLLTGESGTGKSTMARVAAVLKRVAPLAAKHVPEVMESVRLEGAHRVSLGTIPWYVEFAIAGATNELIDLQLFGSVKSAAIGTVDHVGVFELAKNGRRRPGLDPISEAADMTGGMVFLDDISDLPSIHQAKLLPVVSGGGFYRIGTEGDPKRVLSFRGSLITASWKPLTRMRQDLLSRLATYELRVPSLGERMEDFPQILTSIESVVCARIVREIEHITRVEPHSDKEYWAMRLKSLKPLEAAARRRLVRIDWSRHGNLRGLTSVVEHMMTRGCDADRAISMLGTFDLTRAPEDADVVSELLNRLLARAPSQEGLAGHLASLELEVRAKLREQLLSNRHLFGEVAERLGIPRETLLHQVHQLTRNRSRSA